MGLDCSHGAFHGAYSSFNRLRQEIARECGGSFPPHEDPKLDPNCWYWHASEVPAEHREGMQEFLNHSDCDGEVSPEMCVKVAGALEWVAARLRVSGDGHLKRHGLGEVGGTRSAAEKFAAGCRAAAEKGESLAFG